VTPGVTLQGQRLREAVVCAVGKDGAGGP
jgi:hypothetical protein